MDCTDTRNAMHGYLDRELDPVRAAGIEEHLHACTACAQAYAVQKSLQSAVRSEATYYRAPAALESRIRAMTGATEEIAIIKPSRRWHWLQLGAALVATALVTWVAAIQMQSVSRDERTAEEVVAGHARAVLADQLTQVAASDQHTVKPWLSSKLDFSPPVTDLARAGFPLVGARVDYVDRRPVAALVYRHRQHTIDLFVWPDAKSPASIQATSRQGFNLLHWRSAGMTFWAISDLNPADIRTFAETYAGAGR